MANCSSCNAPIVWAATESGKPMPLEARPVHSGNLAAHRGPDGTLHVRVFTLDRPNLMEGEHPAESHFVKCPAADEHRRARV